MVSIAEARRRAAACCPRQERSVPATSAPRPAGRRSALHLECVRSSVAAGRPRSRDPTGVTHACARARTHSRAHGREHACVQPHGLLPARCRQASDRRLLAQDPRERGVQAQDGAAQQGQRRHQDDGGPACQHLGTARGRRALPGVAHELPGPHRDVLVHGVVLLVVAREVADGQRREPEDGQREDATEDEEDEPTHVLAHIPEAQGVAGELHDHER
mmetsp:Transcript_74266/g.229513  ORF Transcript_74266/g.229513 Transcript_74266/m.229513 type:complete len:217 (-) Transcript_74266:372-1022(-)